MIKMKISAIKFEIVLKVLGRTDHFGISYTPTDEVAIVYSQSGLDNAREQIMARYGDVEVELHPEAIWSRQVVIKDENFQKDLDKFYKNKSEWCEKYGCD